MTSVSAAPEGPIPVTEVGKVGLPPWQLLRMRRQILGTGLDVPELFVPGVLLPVEPPSGNAGFGMPLGRNLNLKYTMCH